MVCKKKQRVVVHKEETGSIYRHSGQENDPQVFGNRVLPVMVAILPHVRVHRIMQKKPRMKKGWVWLGFGVDRVPPGRLTFQRLIGVEGREQGVGPLWTLSRALVD